MVLFVKTTWVTQLSRKHKIVLTSNTSETTLSIYCTKKKMKKHFEKWINLWWSTFWGCNLHPNWWILSPVSVKINKYVPSIVSLVQKQNIWSRPNPDNSNLQEQIEKGTIESWKQRTGNKGKRCSLFFLFIQYTLIRFKQTEVEWNGTLNNCRNHNVA